jgi:hypothetical protein
MRGDDASAARAEISRQVCASLFHRGCSWGDRFTSWEVWGEVWLLCLSERVVLAILGESVANCQCVSD